MDMRGTPIVRMLAHAPHYGGNKFAPHYAGVKFELLRVDGDNAVINHLVKRDRVLLVPTNHVVAVNDGAAALLGYLFAKETEDWQVNTSQSEIDNACQMDIVIVRAIQKQPEYRAVVLATPHSDLTILPMPGQGIALRQRTLQRNRISGVLVDPSRG